MKTEKIIKALDKLDPSEEMENEIFNTIKQKQNNITLQLEHKPIKQFKPKVVIAATLIAVLFLMSAGYAMIAVRYFDMEGNSFLKYFPLRQNKPITSEEIALFESKLDEMTLFEKDFSHSENNENIWLRVIRNDENESGRVSFSAPHRVIHDYEEFMKYTDEEIFKTPQYIPDGYTFSTAEVYFFLDENFDVENLELVYREEKFGNIYEKYYVPENLENISYLTITYTKEENGKELSLCYTISLYEPEYINVGIGGAENAQGEILQTPQFDRNILMSTDYKENEISFTRRIFNGKKAIPTRHGQTTWGKVKYGTVEYRIDTQSLSRDEIVKIAESIK